VANDIPLDCPLHLTVRTFYDVTTPKEQPLAGGGERVSPLHYWRELHPQDDPYDWRLWLLARRMFVANLRKYGLVKTTDG
jgi:hypothetical protein